MEVLGVCVNFSGGVKTPKNRTKRFIIFQRVYEYRVKIMKLIYKMIIVGIIIFVIFLLSMPSTTSKEQQNTSVGNRITNVTTETTNPIVVTPTPEPAPSYVTCSNYKRIVDKWKTPSGSYVKFEDNTTVGLTEPYNSTFGYYYTDGIGNESFITLLGDHYSDIHIGEYAIPCESHVYANSYSYCMASLSYGKSFKLIHVSEKESGYRDACIVVED